MGFSETIIAASIGAGATVVTALFQLFGALGGKAKAVVPNKRGISARSVVAIFALMIASALGGFMFSELRQERADQSIRALREELNTKLQALEDMTARLAEQRTPAPSTAPTATAAVPAVAPIPAAPHEASVYAPACAADGCTEAQAQKMWLCDSVPATLQVTEVGLFVREATVQGDWDAARVTFDQDAGGAKFVAPMQAETQNDAKRVCVNFAHWSNKPHVARMVLQVGPAEHSLPSLNGADGGAAHAAITMNDAITTAAVGSGETR